MRRLLIIVLASGLISASAGATVLLPADFKDLVNGSQVIVHGTVVDVRAAWMDGRQRIDTLVTLEATDYFKGNFGPTITFRVPGGELGLYRTFFVGAPRFAEGDEVVLFLDARGPSIPYVFGLSQGVFRVTADAHGEKVVIPPALLSTSATTVRVVRGAADRQPLALQAFGARVRQVLAPPSRRRR